MRRPLSEQDALNSAIERFCRNFIVNPMTGCWVWQGFLTFGYGRIEVRNAYIQAHRYSFALFRGPIPVGKELDHICRCRSCVNPFHLEPVTHQENFLRSPITVAAKNRNMTICRRGHRFNGENIGYRKDGKKYCLLCARLRQAQYLRARGGGKADVSITDTNSRGPTK